MTRTKRVTICVLAIAVVAAVGAAPARAQWQWDVGMYLWALGLDGDMTVRGQTASTEVSFGDIFDKLQFAFSLHVEAHEPAEKWTVIFDAYIAQLGDDLDTPPGEFDMDMGFFELGAAYRTGQEFDVLFGLRYVELDALLRIRPGIPQLPPEIQAGDKQSYVDPMVGGRWIKQGEKWGFRGRFDAAGFGVSDGSDLTLNLQLLGSYRRGERFSLLFGYRVMDIDYEDTDAGFGMDVTMSGPVLAAAWSF